MSEVNVTIQKESKGFNGSLIFLDISDNLLNGFTEQICTESLFAVSWGIINVDNNDCNLLEELQAKTNEI